MINKGSPPLRSSLTPKMAEFWEDLRNGKSDVGLCQGHCACALLEQ